jgi:hypothetical protein
MAPQGTIESGPWGCPSCAATAESPFCPACGEARPRPKDLSLRAFVIETFHTLTDVDGRVVRSFRALLFQPGLLTQAYGQGRRKEYLGPLQIFLVANVLFFGVEAATHVNIFSTTLESHVRVQDWKVLANELVTGRLQTIGASFDDYARRFDSKAVRNAKSLVGLMALPFAFTLPLFYGRRRSGFVLRAAFALHLYAFLLVVFCIALGFATLERLFGGDGLRSASVDLALTIGILTTATLYLYFALARVYSDSGGVRAAKAVGLAFLIGVFVVGYRFFIFLVTLYTTR